MVCMTAHIVGTKNLGNGKRLLTVDHEVSRMIVHINDAYTGVGCQAQVRLPRAIESSDGLEEGTAKEFVLKPASPPVSFEDLDRSIYKLRGDISAGQTKLDETAVSTRASLEVIVTEEDHGPLYDLQEGDDVEVGPFVGLAIDLRKLMFVYGYPTLLLVTEGDDIATAKALVEATRGGLDLEAREAVRVYNLLHASEHAILSEEMHTLEQKLDSLKVERVVRSRTAPQGKALKAAFDDDCELEYEPEATGVLLLTDSSQGRIKQEVMELMRHADIPEENLVRVCENGE